MSETYCQLSKQCLIILGGNKQSQEPHLQPLDVWNIITANEKVGIRWNQ